MSLILKDIHMLSFVEQHIDFHSSIWMPSNKYAVSILAFSYFTPVFGSTYTIHSLFSNSKLTNSNAKDNTRSLFAV